MTTVNLNPAGLEPAAAEICPPGREAWRMFRRNIAAVAGLVMLCTIVLVCVLGPVVFPVDPFEIVWAPLTPPGESEYLFGTDYLGRDVLAGIVYGGKATLVVGITAALLSVVIGVTIGALAGYHGGWVDSLMMRITEFFQVLPALLLAMALITLFSPTLTTITVAIGIVSWPAVARLARAEFLRIKQLEFVRAARAISASDARIILRVILPNALPPLIVMAALNTGTAILFEAGLSFLGLGDPSQMSWGMMIGSNRDYILSAWWPVTLPGIAIFLTVLSISLIGDGLNDAFNPKLRER
ncbi:MAG TPA: ABC transporter permease [Candidatus Competibacteraceae bacterium]|nr:ABC transporter permease [Candidatus Competibacteraceae bacterium]